MKRVMCVYLPKWPMQRLVHERPELRARPLALVDSRAARGPLVVHCNRAARHKGIQAGMPVAEARAFAGGLHLEEENLDGDRHALERLATWAERYGPNAGLEEGPAPHGLLVDVSGCGAYFHSEENLAGRVNRELGAAGWTARVAIAGTLGAAWAVAHYAPAPGVVPPAETERAVRPLPVAALRLPAEVRALLRNLGIERVGQLLDLPRADLPVRFGAIVVQRLDQALGRVPELLLPHRPLPEVQAHQAFEYGIDRLEVLHQVLEQLTESIAASLLRMNRGARQVECRLHHERAEPVRLVVGLSRPRRSAPYLGMLLRTQLERVQLAEPVVAVSLHAVMVEPLADNQHDLFETERAHEEELSALIDRLSNRLGPEAVTRPLLLADAQPEYACRFEPVVPARHEQQAAPGKEKARPRRKAKRAAAPPLFTPDAGHRPLRLWPRPALIQVLAMLGEVPLKFRWQGEEHRIVRLWGPERIATGWWRGQDVQRDYYIVATQRGPRFWIFRQPQDGRWFLHGCFD